MKDIKLENGNVKVSVTPEEILVHGVNWQYKLSNSDRDSVFQLITKGDLHEATHRALSAYYSFCNHFQSC